jgi:uncharacterized spore protein YtfJ
MELQAATEEMVRQIANLPQELDAASCFGTPVEREGHTLIPVARVSFGYGVGFGGGTGTDKKRGGDGLDAPASGEGLGGGGGGGGNATPVAVVDISRDSVEIKPIVDESRIARTAIMTGAWVAFWLLWTVRTISREHQKTRRLSIEKARD